LILRVRRRKSPIKNQESRIKNQESRIENRKPMLAGGKLVIVPVSTKDWSAHVPTDAQPAVKSLLGRLKSL